MRLRTPRSFEKVEEICAARDRLIDSWCERRCLIALAKILHTDWPANSLTDGWASLLNSLKDVRAFARQQITPEELDVVEDLILSVERTLNRR
ncbi:MAG TPA: hypothetical protein VGR50_06185 [Terriglobales bacterium]|nr:hypothetical protein [Terriglobales bacterium]